MVDARRGDLLGVNGDQRLVYDHARNGVDYAHIERGDLILESNPLQELLRDSIWNQPTADEMAAAQLPRYFRLEDTFSSRGAFVRIVSETRLDDSSAETRPPDRDEPADTLGWAALDSQLDFALKEQQLRDPDSYRPETLERLTSGLFDVALPLASQGRHREAEAAVERILSRNIPSLMSDADQGYNYSIRWYLRIALRKFYWDAHSLGAWHRLASVAEEFATRLCPSDGRCTCPGWCPYGDLLHDIDLMRSHEQQGIPPEE